MLIFPLVRVALGKMNCTLQSLHLVKGTQTVTIRISSDLLETFHIKDEIR